MKGFPRRGSDQAALEKNGATLDRLNEGLPQKGKRSPGSGRSSSLSAGLNEGLPQKGKRWPACSPAPVAVTCLNEGLPQKGKRCVGHPRYQTVRSLASMKGFPRRGSDTPLEAVRFPLDEPQ